MTMRDNLKVRNRVEPNDVQVDGNVALLARNERDVSGHNPTCREPGLLGRRTVLRAAVAGGLLAGLDQGGMAWAQTALDPAAAVTRLMDGNRRFVEKRLTSFQEDLDILKQNTTEKQEPFAAVLSCADSRVPVEVIFDQTIGHVFVARVAGNIASAEIIASLEYGAAVLGTRAIMVMGHGACGAVKAAIDAKPVPGQISTLYRHIRPAVDRAGGDLTEAVKANARIQAGLLRDSSPVIAEMVKQARLTVVASYYDLASGQVTLLD
jgi:carbonic anhydrase